MAIPHTIEDALARFDAALKAMESLAERSRAAGQRAAAADLEYTALKADRARIAEELAEVRRKTEALAAAQKAAEAPIAAAMEKISTVIGS